MDEAPSPAASGAAPYRVLARKYRPRSFGELIGQEPMVRTLTNAFASGRIAQAFLLTGVRGVGKTTTARILARALNYSRTGTSDRPSIDFAEMGEHCQAIVEGRHVDVIEMDAASHTGIGDIREIIEAVRYKPAIARYKVYIIDEVHMLSNQAFNGLLKTLEEPPEHVKFIFATTEIRKVPVTVLSRCQRFDLRRIEADRLVTLLSEIITQEGIEAEREALAMIARAAEGSARDSLSLLDQSIAHASSGEGGRPRIMAEDVRQMLGLADRGRIIDLFESTLHGDAPASLALLDDLHRDGADPLVVLEELANFTHLVTRLRITPDAAEDPALTEEERTRGTALAAALSLRVLSRTWQLLMKGIEETKESPAPAASADMVLVRIAHAADLPTPDEAIRLLQGGGGIPAGAATAAAALAPAAPRAIAPEPARAVRAAPQPLARESSEMPPWLDEPVRAEARAPEMRAAAPREMTRSNGSAAMASQPATGLEPEARRLLKFEDVVALADEKRDLRIKVELEHHVRLIRFEAGRIEFAPTPDASPTLASDLSRKLGEWTGRRWVVSIGRDPGEPTLAERHEAQRQQLVTDAKADPLVAAVLAKFPGAEIVDVRVLAPEPKLDAAPDMFATELPPNADDEDN